MFVSMATFVSIGPTFVSMDTLPCTGHLVIIRCFFIEKYRIDCCKDLFFFLQPEYEKKQVEKEKVKFALEVSQLPEEDKRTIHQKSKLLKAIASKLIWSVCGR